MYVIRIVCELICMYVYECIYADICTYMQHVCMHICMYVFTDEPKVRRVPPKYYVFMYVGVYACM